MKHNLNCNSKLTKKNKFCSDSGTAFACENGHSVDQTKKSSLNTATVIVIILLLMIIATLIFFLFAGMKLFDNFAITQTGTPEITLPDIAFSDNPEAISVASQSVVKLNCYDKSGEIFATGSGFACIGTNVIVTNYHVVDGGVYRIEASTETGRTFELTHMLAMDEDNDIAILATKDSHNLAVLKPGDSNSLQKGEKVVAIGSPLGLLNSVSTGVFSGYVDESGINALQFTASISSGSSGGALFNDAGEVLGVTFASYESGQNINLAIPIEQVISLFNSRDSSITIQEWYNKYYAGYEHTSKSQCVDYLELVKNPETYNGRMITVYAYVTDATSSKKSGDTLIINGIMYTLPNDEYMSSDEMFNALMYGYTYCWQSMSFDESFMIKCTDLTQNFSLEKYEDKYIYVTGVFGYEIDNRIGTASLDVYYIED